MYLKIKGWGNKLKLNGYLGFCLRTGYLAEIKSFLLKVLDICDLILGTYVNILCNWLNPLTKRTLLVIW